jgi:hypothetical protein
MMRSASVVLSVIRQEYESSRKPLRTDLTGLNPSPWRSKLRNQIAGYGYSGRNGRSPVIFHSDCRSALMGGLATMQASWNLEDDLSTWIRACSRSRRQFWAVSISGFSRRSKYSPFSKLHGCVTWLTINRQKAKPQTSDDELPFIGSNTGAKYVKRIGCAVNVGKNDFSL